jgi:septal ring factor EnvC (AmiA/AmiB activator)
MPRKGITFARVDEACQELLKAGQRLTVRAVQQRTGGSMSTVLKHLQRWQHGRPEAPQPDRGDFSPQLRKALQREIQERTAILQQPWQERLSASMAEAEAARAQLAVAEQCNRELHARLQQAEQAARSQQQNWNQRLDQLQQQLDEARCRLRHLEQQLSGQAAADAIAVAPAEEPASPPTTRTNRRGRKSAEPAPQKTFDF